MNNIRKGLAVAVIILFVSISVIPSTGRILEKSYTASFDGNIFYVGGSGPGNYTKIQDAIDNASDGDTVFVYDDSSPYYESIKINKRINLVGKDKNTTVIDGTEFYEIIQVLADWVNLSGFTIKGKEYYTSLCTSISLYQSNNTKILNNIIGPVVFGISIEDSEYCTIANNYISTTLDGIYVYESSRNSVIKNNMFFNSGIVIRSSNNTISWNNFKDGYLSVNNFNNTILENMFYDSGLGIYSSNISVINNSFFNGGIGINPDSYPVVVLNNTVNNKPLVYLINKSDMIIDFLTGQIILIGCSNITVKNQEITKTTNGIFLIHSDNCIVNNNIICTNQWNGIELFSTSNCEISNNYFANQHTGIELFSTSNSVISNNYIADQQQGIWLGESNCNNYISKNTLTNNVWGLFIDNISSHNVVDGNNISSSEDLGVALLGSDNIISNNLIIDNGNGYPPFCRIFPTACGIWLSGLLCKNNTISNNSITLNNNFGIWSSKAWVWEKGPSQNKITGNKIFNNRKGGIGFLHSDNNTISFNNISKHIWGIYLRWSSDNTITSNNFIKNFRQAQFSCCYKNHWDSNYWGRPRRYLYPIFGRRGYYIGFLPWINIDWHPAKQPYIIPTGEV